VKTKCGKDITREGSGNVGTVNTFKVSHSKKLTLIVFILDFLKGFVPVFYMAHYMNANLLVLYISSIFLVIGHNYSIWLKSKGGRGLATAAGIFAVINYPLLITWCVIWAVFISLKRGVLFSNFCATFLLPFITILVKRFYMQFTYPPLSQNYYVYFIFYTVVIALLILSKHWMVVSKILPAEAKGVN
jgi:glycerol-3-phosphate acyltransferase PlsY